MTAQERVQVLLTARLLEGASRINGLSTGFTLLAIVLVVVDRNTWMTTVPAVILGALAKIYAVRIAFDAGLFADIAAEKLTSADLDAAFPKKAGRSWDARCRGARRLIVNNAVLTLLQCALLVFTSAGSR